MTISRRGFIGSLLAFVAAATVPVVEFGRRWFWTASDTERLLAEMAAAAEAEHTKKMNAELARFHGSTRFKAMPDGQSWPRANAVMTDAWARKNG